MRSTPSILGQPSWLVLAVATAAASMAAATAAASTVAERRIAARA
jgi:hypothetical protein